MYIHIYMYISFLGRKILLRRLLEEHNYRGDNICRKQNDAGHIAARILPDLPKSIQFAETANIAKELLQEKTFTPKHFSAENTMAMNTL